MVHLVEVVRDRDKARDEGGFPGLGNPLEREVSSRNKDGMVSIV